MVKEWGKWEVLMKNLKSFMKHENIIWIQYQNK